MSRIALPVIGLALLFLLPFSIIPAIDAGAADFWQHIFVTIFVFAAMACAWNIIGGFAGQLSLGQTIFYGIGGYAAALLNQHFGIVPWLAGPVGAVISIVVAIVISWPCLRLRGPFFALSTIAFLEVIRLLAIHFKDFTGGTAGLPIPMFVGTEQRIGWAWMLFAGDARENSLIIAFGLLLLCLGASWLVRRSRFGFYLVAVREREDAAKAVGVNTTLVKLSAFALSAGLTSLVGTFHGVYLNFIDPDTMFSLMLAIQIAMFALIGGVSTVTGPVWGTLLVVPIAEVARGWLGAAANGLHGFVYGVVLVLVVLTMPGGLVGTIGPWLRRITGRAGEGAAGQVVAPPPAEATARPPTGEPILEARNVSRRFGGLVATNDVSITLHQGEVIGVIGPNGAGKTTLFNLLSGFLPPSGGGVRVRGADGAWHEPSTPHQFAGVGVARTFQVVQPFAGLTVRENVMLGAFHNAASTSEARRVAEEVLTMVGLGAVMDMPARSLTIGGAKRLEVARALAMKPRVLLLDEVMAGLNPADVTASVELLKRVRDSGVSILAIEHVMAAIMALSDRVVVINSGRMIAEGSPAEISRNPAVLEAYLGEDYVHVEQ